ncbi:unnamed protein product [Oppiella nova]|uniref:Pyruvate phosphate dikinase AMP/ATP-binding domain-containing protein n=1 Tax=Oppiella nova TaxID=334625 RepID=A0A7R9LER0_9ACAR|nr:unnamed protein product [Oppiella nova]CAG2162914.1 unnamed protein product [Oppiella nova]
MTKFLGNDSNCGQNMSAFVKFWLSSSLLLCSSVLFQQKLNSNRLSGDLMARDCSVLSVNSVTLTPHFRINDRRSGQLLIRAQIPVSDKRRQHKCNRIVTHDLYRDEVHHSGLLPFPHEWQYDLPSLNKSENLLIYGVNSSKQNIYIAIKWRPKGVDNRVKASISLRFDDNNSNTYTLEEDSEVEYRPNEYRMGGLGLEINTPFRRKRIKFRGYLSKNDNQLVYVRFRFLWYAVSRVYDFTHDFDDHFMAKEMALSPKSDTSDNRFEDRFEQFGQIKGTFGEELTNERELYFWGSMSKKVDLSGGKGSSLAVLKSLSEDIVKEDYENQFIVPNGVIVTTYAYQRLLRDHKELLQEIQELEESTQLSPKELKTKCDELMNSISAHSLPQVIKQDIKHKLSENFNDFETKQFAVRSSGASEDSEEMSAAGQMSTYLGVRGLEEIYSSVMMCWSSQFSHIAVQYKRGYGQPINSPMAVVIQEMIDCQSAGVMFTCDPMTGDERHLEITANYGLGESVVSASSEPDTIKVSVNIESNSLSTRRRVNGIESKVIGQKKTLIKLSDSGGTVEEEVDDPSNCCVSDDHLIRLADIGLRIHKHYGNARDIVTLDRPPHPLQGLEHDFVCPYKQLSTTTGLIPEISPNSPFELWLEFIWSPMTQEQRDRTRGDRELKTPRADIYWPQLLSLPKNLVIYCRGFNRKDNTMDERRRYVQQFTTNKTDDVNDHGNACAYVQGWTNRDPNMKKYCYYGFYGTDVDPKKVSDLIVHNRSHSPYRDPNTRMRVRLPPVDFTWDFVYNRTLPYPYAYNL